ncbi:MAG TPA: type II toxin-antitoxin system HicA family toxin [Ignavibacteria bacterium]|nr:type II toxin-antitoxin system HicA family toxin [Ignavibacteria bacterium]
MTKNQKLIQKILSGKSDANIKFTDLYNLLLSLNFDVRIKGSHHIFRKESIKEKINLQKDGKNAKPYQVYPVE